MDEVGEDGAEFPSRPWGDAPGKCSGGGEEGNLPNAAMFGSGVAGAAERRGARRPSNDAEDVFASARVCSVKAEGKAHGPLLLAAPSAADTARDAGTYTTNIVIMGWMRAQQASATAVWPPSSTHCCGLLSFLAGRRPLAAAAGWTPLPSKATRSCRRWRAAPSSRPLPAAAPAGWPSSAMRCNAPRLPRSPSEATRLTLGPQECYAPVHVCYLYRLVEVSL